MSQLTNGVFFTNQTVRPLESSDFNLGTKEPITLKWSDCMLILFYGNNKESIDLASIWEVAARIAAGVIYAAINIEQHFRVAQAFMKIKETNSTYRPFALQGYPFILVYQNGFPVGFYNGERAVQPIVDFSMTLACQPSYYEPRQYASGVSTTANYEMGGYKYHKPYDNSVKFRNGDSFRGFDPSQPVVLTGSTVAAAEAGRAQAQQIAEGVTPLGRAETPQTTLATGVQPQSTGEPAEAAGNPAFTAADEPITADEEARRGEIGEQQAAARAEGSGALTPQQLAEGAILARSRQPASTTVAEQEAQRIAQEEAEKKIMS